MLLKKGERGLPERVLEDPLIGVNHPQPPIKAIKPDIRLPHLLLPGWIDLGSNRRFRLSHRALAKRLA